MEKKILTALAVIFFLFMIAFTFISRVTAVKLLPEVECGYAGGVNGEVLPKTALCTDERGNDYVYFLIEEDSILGKVTVVKRLPVKVLSENGEEVTLEGTAEYSNFEFVLKNYEDLKEKDRVRRNTDG